ncbi:46 kDa FK506-binding nuclear protein-like [Hydractinia symbiolongicarpus]|uniref:46 kDa FK506-binding nuclear protein-like n=1 Tax=Hydractinia symbiolongicarpus TaxID=13093 RepID=UPI00254A9614|nr:46 kDa FK506-binding nuclear protein-like [Hydractinia symbiolongicarpus]XP_057307793.1 46 kDa FK506-binding nuclear protein-like [Hydractinia symbiolongicarpus]
MFWGITLESGKKYTQVLQRSFHVTMAALGFEPVTSEPVAVVVDVNKAQFVLCTLQADKIPQQTLNLNFTEGEEVSFSIEGDGEVHLTGYLLPTPHEYIISSSDEDTANSEEQEEEETEDNEEDSSDYVDAVRLIEEGLNLKKKKAKHDILRRKILLKRKDKSLEADDKTMKKTSSKSSNKNTDEITGKVKQVNHDQSKENTDIETASSENHVSSSVKTQWLDDVNNNLSHANVSNNGKLQHRKRKVLDVGTNSGATSMKRKRKKKAK